MRAKICAIIPFDVEKPGLSLKEKNMEVPEYFCLFPGQGEFCVEVKFKGDGFVAPRQATAQQIAHLVNLKTGAFHTAMTFDEHLFEVYKYEIDPIKKKLLIRAR